MGNSISSGNFANSKFNFLNCNCISPLINRSSRNKIYKFLSSTIKLIFQNRQIFSFFLFHDETILLARVATPSSPPPLFPSPNEKRSPFPLFPAGNTFSIIARCLARVSRNVIECWRARARGFFSFFFLSEGKNGRDAWCSNSREFFFFFLSFFSRGDLRATKWRDRIEE